MCRRIVLAFVWVGSLTAAGEDPLRLGAPAPDRAVETASGKSTSLSRHLREHRRDTVLVVPRLGESVSRAEIDEAQKILAERGADLLVAPPQPPQGRPGLDALAPVVVLIDSGGVVRRIEPGRPPSGRQLGEFMDQWRLGRDVFLTACARCHGDDGSLEVCGDVKRLTGIGNRLTPAQVYERLRVGELGQHEVLVRGRFHKRNEIEAVVVFVRGL